MQVVHVQRAGEHVVVVALRCERRAGGGGDGVGRGAQEADVAGFVGEVVQVEGVDEGEGARGEGCEVV